MILADVGASHHAPMMQCIGQCFEIILSPKFVVEFVQILWPIPMVGCEICSVLLKIRCYRRYPDLLQFSDILGAGEDCSYRRESHVLDVIQVLNHSLP
jgi:hypothetical protein